MITRGIQYLTARPWASVVLLTVVFALGYFLRGEGSAPSVHNHENMTEAEGQTQERWTCSMHPQIILPTNDQKCPICNMDLIPLDTSGSEGLGPRDLRLSPEAAALADIVTSPVRREFVSRDIRLVGKVRADETRTRTITARVAGRLDRLYVDAAGKTVTRNMKLAEIYSPELYAAQTELQTAARAVEIAGDSGERLAAARANLKSSEERLRLWGLTQDQIKGIAAGEDISENLTIRSPSAGVVIDRVASEGDYIKTGSVLFEIADLDQVWVVLEAYETDLALLRSGQPVEFTARAFPGRVFSGEIMSIEPVLSEITRAVEVRVEAENSEGLLKPGMLVSGRVAVTVDAEGSPVENLAEAEAPLVIPASAPLMTGERAVVYVRHPGPGDPVFSGRTVILGPRAGDKVLVFSGLDEGDVVVTHGAFKIDSALQIQAKPSMMNPVNSGSGASCFGPGLGNVLAAYNRLQAALVADDEAGSVGAADDVVAALTALDCPTEDLSEVRSFRWLTLMTAMSQAAGSMVEAETLAQLRIAFQPLSENLWPALEEFGGGQAETVRLFHCPMAFDNTGAHWIQTDASAANPYFGEAMLRCGSLEGVLTADATEPEEGS